MKCARYQINSLAHNQIRVNRLGACGLCKTDAQRSKEKQKGLEQMSKSVTTFNMFSISESPRLSVIYTTYIIQQMEDMSV